jgi:hypothetical protein
LRTKPRVTKVKSTSLTESSRTLNTSACNSSSRADFHEMARNMH